MPRRAAVTHALAFSLLVLASGSLAQGGAVWYAYYRRSRELAAGENPSMQVQGPA